MNEIEKTAIYDDYYLKVRNYILKKVNNYHLAEDLCSDVFVKVYEKLDTFDSKKASLSTWIFTIARNRLIDYYRSNKITSELNENIAIEEDDESILNDDNLQILADSLNKLSEKERDVLINHYYSGITLKETAVKMGISYAYAKLLHTRSLAKLKKFF